MNTDKIYAEAIANKYAPKDTSKVIALKKLDRRAKQPACIFAFSFGVIMALLLGVGMCMSMQVIGNDSVAMMVVGIIGITGVNINYPIYKKMIETGKQKYAFEIMQLAKEISEKAGVNRSTFYLHYETIGDLIEETIESITDDFQKAFQKNSDNFIGKIADTPLNELILVEQTYLRPYLNFRLFAVYSG